jgi:hypothetical protein
MEPLVERNNHPGEVDRGEGELEAAVSQTTKSHHARKNGPDLAGDWGWRPGPALWGRASPDIKFHLHCHCLQQSEAAQRKPLKSHVAAQDDTTFQGGGSGEGRGHRPNGPSS